MPTPIIIECELCGWALEKKSPRQRYHPDCREFVKGKQNRENQRKRYSEGKHWRQVKQEERKDPTQVDQGYANFAFAVVEQAFRDGDFFWLTEFGMEFLAFSGNPLNQRKFDGLLEEMNGRKETKTQLT